MHDPFAVRLVPAPPDVLLEHRGLRLLGLEEQRVSLVAAEHQDDPGPGAHAADAHDLAGHVGEVELLEQVAAVALQGPPVASQHAPQELVDLVALDTLEEVPDRLDEGRVADDASLPVHDVGELVEGLEAVAGPGLGHVGLGLLPDGRADLVLQVLDGVLDVHVGVPDVEVGQARELAHRRAVLADQGQQHRAALLGWRSRCRAPRWRSWPPGA